MERSTMLLMGKSTISMAIFNSYVSHYQRVSMTICWSYPTSWCEPGQPGVPLARARSRSGVRWSPPSGSCSSRQCWRCFRRRPRGENLPRRCKKTWRKNGGTTLPHANDYRYIYIYIDRYYVDYFQDVIDVCLSIVAHVPRFPFFLIYFGVAI